MRAHRSGLVDASAECNACGWQADGRNAMAIGSQHAQRTGHHVIAMQTIAAVWNHPDDAAPIVGEAPR